MSGGRLKYIEPTLVKNYDGSVGGNAIPYPYEDYNMAVDLSVRFADRYSCGLGELVGGLEDISWSSQNGTISFLGGTELDGRRYLTTNFTDVSMVDPTRNTAECLGIESINITYNSWQYPTVDIKFTDVRGATIMQPAEQIYHNEGTDKGPNAALYRALFSFPYPIFTLKVKGFYGKGVTYKLAVQKTKMDFDANTGNFNIMVNFVGYMFGIYADMPMTYLAIAPYTESGYEYWQNKVNDGTFSFYDASGQKGHGDMLRIPELRLKLAQVATSEEYINAAAQGQQVREDLTAKIDAITALKESYPFTDWYEGGSYLYKVEEIGESTKDEKTKYTETSSAITSFLTALSGHDATYGTKYYNKFNGLNEYLKRKNKTMDCVVYEQTKQYGSTVEYHPSKKTEELYIKAIKSQEDVEAYVKSAHRTNNFNVYVIPKTSSAERWGDIGTLLDKEAEDARQDAAETERKYKEIQSELAENALGFRPSIRNIYNLMFAHMDTFMHCFYEKMKTIQSQLSSSDSCRSVEGQNATMTDIPKVGERSKWLPPFAAYYKKDGGLQAGTERCTFAWPEDVLTDGSTLEEVSLVRELLTGANIYTDDAEETEKRISEMGSGSTAMMNGDAGKIVGAPSISINSFIPTTTYDYANNGSRANNPYMHIASKVKDNDGSIDSDIMGTFALRAFYYLCCNQSNSKNEAKSFGVMEAINFFKAVGDSVSENFIQFIKKYADGNYSKDKKTFINIITSTSDSDGALEWRFDAENSNKNLFSAKGDDLYYNLYKPRKDDGNKYLPLYMANFNDVKNAFIGGDDNLRRNHAYITTENISNAYGSDDSENSTFYCFDGARDYISSIYTAIDNDIAATTVQIEGKMPEYGKRRDSDFGEVVKQTRTLKNYKDNFKESLKGKAYKNGTIVTMEDGKEISTDDNSAISMIAQKGYAEQENYFVKYPSIVNEGNGLGTGLVRSLFDEELYKKQTNVMSKAYLFLAGMPIAGNEDFGGIEEKAHNGITLKSKLLREGSYYWRYDAMEDGDDPIITDGLDITVPTREETFCGDLNYSAGNGGYGGGSNGMSLRTLNVGKDFKYPKWKAPSNMSASRRRYLKKYFMDWAADTGRKGFAGNEKRLADVNLYGKKLNSKDEKRYFSRGLDIANIAGNENNKSDNAREARALQTFLRDAFFNVCTVFDLYSGIIGENEDFKISSDIMEGAFKGFMKELHAIYGDTAREAKKNPESMSKKALASTSMDPFKNKDLRIATYMTLKSLYDKWMANPYNGYSHTWTIGDELSDFENFVYTDSFYHRIGDELLVNITKVSSWLSSCLPTLNVGTSEGVMQYTGRTIYEFLAEVAQDSGGMLLALPQKWGCYDEDDMLNMFRPFSVNSNWNEDQSSFIFMYTYKPSEFLGDSTLESVDMNGFSPDGDGFNIDDPNELIGAITDNNGGTIPGFGVTYAKQNQSFFKNITLSTDTQGVTEASLAATYDIASKASEAPRESTLYGQDLYRVFSKYSYTAGVEMMGNMQIMPLMYFQLNNVPLWKGAYMIKKVTHSITQGNMSTNFEGVRINRYAIPMSDSVIMTTRETGMHESLNATDVPTQTTDTMTGGMAIGTTSFTPNGGNPSAQLPFTQMYDDDAVDYQHPVIAVWAAHTPNKSCSKYAEHMWSKKLVDEYIIPKLQKMTFKDGKPMSKNVQKCGYDNESRTTGDCGYSSRDLKGLLKKLGDNNVVSLVPHWNGGYSNYFMVCWGMGKASTDTFPERHYNNLVPNPEGKKLAEAIEGSARDLVRNSDKLKSLPVGAMGNGFKNGFLRDIANRGTDPSVMTRATAVLVENWFGDYMYLRGEEKPKDTKWYSCTEKDSEGRYYAMKAWLESEEGLNAISDMLVNGIKKYLDTRF